MGFTSHVITKEPEGWSNFEEDMSNIIIFAA
jgi:hypothetical protein